MAVSRRRADQPGQGKHSAAFAMSPGLDLAAGAVSGIAGALVGQPGPPVLIYLLLAGTAARTVRATLLAFFALSYGVTLASHAATIGITAPTWLAAGILIPFAFVGGLAGRPIGDRLGAEAFAKLAIVLLAMAGAYTLGAAAVALPPPRDDRAREERSASASRTPPHPAPIFGAFTTVTFHVYGRSRDEDRKRTRSAPRSALAP
jgi:uncharacterized membrane protein YfcA